MKKKLSIEMPILVDTDLEVIKSYGILNKKSGNIPHPTAMIVDKGGKIAYLFVEPDYSVRPEPSAMIEVLEALEKTPSADSAPQDATEESPDAGN